jgi:hypothetical protein
LDALTIDEEEQDLRDKKKQKKKERVEKGSEKTRQRLMRMAFAQGMRHL